MTPVFRASPRSWIPGKEGRPHEHSGDPAPLPQRGLRPGGSDEEVSRRRGKGGSHRPRLHPRGDHPRHGAGAHGGLGSRRAPGGR